MTDGRRQVQAVHELPGMVQIAPWKAFGWLRAGFSTRQGGQSMAYGVAEQNLGWTPEDNSAAVAENRRRFVAAVSGQSEAELVTVRQMHGVGIEVVERRGEPLQTPDGRALLQGDGLITREPGLVLGIQTADCVPVFLADTRNRAVGAFHAGWRGTLAGIAGEGVGIMVREFGSRPEDLVAAIGPSIGRCCFAVGPEVPRQFADRFAYAEEIVELRDGSLYMDLWEANLRQILAAGVRADAISVVGECSACARTEDGRRRYFSHRAEHGVTGRMMSVIGVVDR